MRAVTLLAAFAVALLAPAARAQKAYMLNAYSEAGCRGSSGSLPIGFSECIAASGFKAACTPVTCRNNYAANLPGCTTSGSFSVGFKTDESGTNADGLSLMANDLYWAGCTADGETCSSSANRVRIGVAIVGGCIDMPDLGQYASSITSSLATALGIQGGTNLRSINISKVDLAPKSPLGAIIGGVVGALLVVALGVVGFLYVKKRGPFAGRGGGVITSGANAPVAAGGVNPMHQDK